MIEFLKDLITSNVHFFSLKEQRDYELTMEIKKEKGSANNFFSF